MLFRSSVAQPIAQEIRAFAKAMTAGERRKFLTDSIASNDKAALSALLGGPHYLSGLTLLEKEQFTRLHREKAFFGWICHQHDRRKVQHLPMICMLL